MAVGPKDVFLALGGLSCVFAERDEVNTRPYHQGSYKVLNKHSMERYSSTSLRRELGEVVKKEGSTT